MRGVNKVILVGTLGRDPESKTFANGGSVCNFSIATSESWTDKQTGERKEQTEWHRITLSNKLGEIAQQYLRKGSKVYIEGSLRTRQWTDQNGQERYVTEIRGDQLQMLDSRNSGDSQNNQAPQGGQRGGYPQNNAGYGNQGGYNNQGGYDNNAQGGYGAPQSNNTGYNNAKPSAGNFTPPAQPTRSANTDEPNDDLPF